MRPVSLQILIDEFGRESLEKVGPDVVGAGWARGVHGDFKEEIGGLEEVEGRCREVLEVLVGAGWDVNRGDGG